MMKHIAENPECACEGCLVEQVARLDQMLIAKGSKDLENDIDEMKAEWFEFGRMAGKREAEARIIKLLENDKITRQPVCSNTECIECPAFENGFNRAIALIKGETE